MANEPLRQSLQLLALAMRRFSPADRLVMADAMARLIDEPEEAIGVMCAYLESGRCPDALLARPARVYRFTGRKERSDASE